MAKKAKETTNVVAREIDYSNPKLSKIKDDESFIAAPAELQSAYVEHVQFHGFNADMTISYWADFKEQWEKTHK